jgi:hypothetical protein
MKFFCTYDITILSRRIVFYFTKVCPGIVISKYAQLPAVGVSYTVDDVMTLIFYIYVCILFFLINIFIIYLFIIYINLVIFLFLSFELFFQDEDRVYYDSNIYILADSDCTSVANYDPIEFYCAETDSGNTGVDPVSISS